MARKHDPKIAVLNKGPHPSLSPAIGRGAPAVGQGHRPTEEDIRLRAYHRWEEAGRPDGDGLQFWLDAEHDLDRKVAA